ncbi:MAG: glutathione S-transferase [Alphaproteobacteria bacterium]
MTRSAEQVTRHDAAPACPVLYSFRRCPYAMRARMALAVSGQRHAHREVLLRDKPPEMIAASPKATVPVLQFDDGTVQEESLDIMLWTLKRNDPEHWLTPQNDTLDDMLALIAEADTDFKHHLDRYKYTTRYEDSTDPVHHRTQGMAFLERLDRRLEQSAFLFGDRPALTDYAIFPFVRQFANTDRSWFDRQPAPRLHAWLNGLLNSGLFEHIMRKYPVWSAGDEELYPSLP